MNEMIDRLDAALEGRYRIERELGEGGMATVFLAEDLKHDRKVAIKVLKPELAAVIGGDRFVTEIKTTAALQHPHILPLFDSGSTNGFLYYVMPYVDGESLRDTLDREKQLGVEESVRIAGAVASALHYAHEQGIVHRDIKPANILIHAGEPVVADFGIALAISAAGGGRLTETGMSVGTPHYMSPEQASADREVSARSDTYALACVLYEMLAGEPPHTGSTAQAVLMRILTEEPRDVTDVRKSVPPNVRDALAKALEKLPADRFESAEAFKRALGDPGFRYRPKTGARGAAATREDGGDWLRDARTRILGVVTVLLAVAAGWLALGDSASEPAPSTTYRYLVGDTARDNVFLAMSNRGDVVYQASADGRLHLRIRRAADLIPTEIPNTENADFQTFSPDGEWLAFVTDGELRKVQLSTGTVVTLVNEDIPQLGFPHWAEDGTIFFTSQSRLYRVPEVGGAPERIELEAAFVVFPRLLPDGRTVLFTEAQNPNQATIRILDLETGDTATIVAEGGNAQWSPTGHIVYGHPSGSLFAVPFDLDLREVTGPPVPVLENVFTFGDIAMFELSASGSLAYTGGAAPDVNPTEIIVGWVDEYGTYTELPLTPTDHADMKLSPDGTQLAYTRDEDIYIYDITRGTDRRFTFEGADHHDPVWSPDGRRIAFASTREGRDRDIWVKDIDGRSPAEWRAGREGLEYPAQWLEDGLLVFARAGQGEQTDILWAPDDATGDSTGLVPLLDASWEETVPMVSPDRRYMAYMSNETGETHVFIRQFPDMTGQWQVSDGPVLGYPAWSADGNEVLYTDRESGRIIRAALDFEPTLQVRERRRVTERYAGELEDVHPDGRVLTSRPAGSGVFETDDQELVVAVNWLTELRRRLGAEDR